MSYQPMYPDTTQYPPMGQPMATGPSGTARTSLVLALVAFVLGMALTVVNILSIAKIARETGTRDVNADTLPEHLRPAAFTVGGTMLALVVPSIIGLVALILGIVTCAKPVSNKALGIWAIVISLLTPLLCVVVWTVVGGATIPTQ